MSDANAVVTVRQLRRRWKPHKARLLALRKDHPTHIRFHRCCSWIQQVEAVNGENHDLTLIMQWVAFNALYGQWDQRLREPAADRECWRRFLDRILALDGDGRLSEVLDTHKKLVLAILDDTYLAAFFWKDPTPQKARQTPRDRRQASQWYQGRQYGMILEAVVDRIYLLRCQLVHGAATHDSQLNRKSLRRCTTMLAHLLPAVLTIITDHGTDEDWGTMCYPPQG